MSAKNKQERYGGGFTLIGSLEPIAVGDTFTDWPLHATVLPRIDSIAVDRGTLDATIQQHVDAFHHLELQGTCVAMLGENKNVEACLVKSEGLVTLHNDLLDALFPYLPVKYYDTQFVGERYLPHVTDTANNFLEVGDTAVLESLYLISRKRKLSGGHKKTVVQQYPFRILQ